LPGAVGELVRIEQLVVVVDEVLGDGANVHERSERPYGTFCGLHSQIQRIIDYRRTCTLSRLESTV
jgi:hypothetical protein